MYLLCNANETEINVTAFKIPDTGALVPQLRAPRWGKCLYVPVWPLTRAFFSSVVVTQTFPVIKKSRAIRFCWLLISRANDLEFSLLLLFSQMLRVSR